MSLRNLKTNDVIYVEVSHNGRPEPSLQYLRVKKISDNFLVAQDSTRFSLKTGNALGLISGLSMKIVGYDLVSGRNRVNF